MVKARGGDATLRLALSADAEFWREWSKVLCSSPRFKPRLLWLAGSTVSRRILRLFMALTNQGCCPGPLQVQYSLRSYSRGSRRPREIHTTAPIKILRVAYTNKPLINSVVLVSLLSFSQNWK